MRNTLASLEAQGFQFYRRGGGVIRLVAGWNTKAADVASFVDSACKAVCWRLRGPERER
jgi:hypothetical protein